LLPEAILPVALSIVSNFNGRLHSMAAQAIWALLRQ
jgi:hypothetical protein